MIAPLQESRIKGNSEPDTHEGKEHFLSQYELYVGEHSSPPLPPRTHCSTFTGAQFSTYKKCFTRHVTKSSILAAHYVIVVKVHHNHTSILGLQLKTWWSGIWNTIE